MRKTRALDRQRFSKKEEERDYMTADEFIEYIEERTYPFTFLENVRAQLSELFRKYPEPLLLECVDIGIKQYFRYDTENLLRNQYFSL